MLFRSLAAWLRARALRKLPEILPEFDDHILRDAGFVRDRPAPAAPHPVPLGLF